MKRLLKPTWALYNLARIFSLSLVVVTFLVSSPPAMAEVREVVIDSIVASVNNTPITLRELCDRMTPIRALSIEEASRDPEALYTLDVLILEELIRQEAKQRRISTSPNEIDAYIDDVAARNSLSREAFEKALEDEGKSLTEYKRQIEIDILKSKLASNLLKSGSGITDSEIREYIEEHPELSKSGAKIKLAQIFVSLAGRDKEEAQTLIELVLQKLKQGDEFSELAKTYSESAEGSQGGKLGVLAEEDLSRDIFDAVFSLQDEEHSDVVETAAGFHIFMVEERFVEKSDDNQKIKEEVREVLEKQKLQTRMQTFFTTDLFKQHSVDKKL